MNISKFNLTSITKNNPIQKNENLNFKGGFDKIQDSFEMKERPEMPVYMTTFKNANGEDVLVEVIKGDITKLNVDAIVNAAKNSLLGGGGVDGAIHRAAGPELLEECKKLNGCETGDAKITDGYNLPAKHVIHTVGPDCRIQKEGTDESLKSCYNRSLEVAAENDVKSIAFPAISCGIYAFPLERATEIAVNTTKEFINNDESGIQKVIFTAFDDKTANEYIKNLEQ